jgi:metal-responsive CopG/Arc/MetJ family transcriptional regulator
MLRNIPLSMDADLLNQVDAKAKELHLTRSAAMRALIRAGLDAGLRFHSLQLESMVNYGTKNPNVCAGIGFSVAQ